MLNSQKHARSFSILKVFFVCILVFCSNPSHATYYGGHHYGHSYGHYGHTYRHHYGHTYRHHYGHTYRHHYGHHYKHRRHYGAHGHVSGDAAYIILGILGVAVLSHIISNNQYKRKQKTYYYKQPKAYTFPASTKQNTLSKKTITKQTYIYKENEGWDWLAKDNANYALDIFAIQSQQNLNSGIPKIGFAIAAASNGEMERATRSMRKAVRIDPDALNRVNINDLFRPKVIEISENYKLISNNAKEDNTFMLAALSYLQQDYATANNIIAKTKNDQRQSTINLKRLIKNKTHKSKDKIN